MKFEDLKKIAKKITYNPEDEVKEGEVIDLGDQWTEEVNEAFEALGTPIIMGPTKPKTGTVIRRCVVCSYFGVLLNCPKCPSHPVMLPAAFMHVSRQMDAVGRCCSFFSQSTCIEKVPKKTEWCGDCVTFWEREFHPPSSRLVHIPEAVRPLLIPQREIRQIAAQNKVTLEHEVELKASDFEENEEQEDWEDELEESQDNLDRACSLLVSIKQLLEFLGDRKLNPHIDVPSAKEAQNFSTAISETLKKCGFDSDEYREEVEACRMADDGGRDPNSEFDEHDREFLENMANRTMAERVLSGGQPQMID